MQELNWIRPYLAVGPIIGSRYGQTRWEALRKNNITAIIDLNNSQVEQKEAQFLGYNYHAIKISDPPFTPKELLDAFPKVIKWINDERKVNGKVYLHCTGGSERSPTFASAYIMFDEGLTTNQSMMEVIEKCPSADLLQGEVCA